MRYSRVLTAVSVILGAVFIRAQNTDRVTAVRESAIGGTARNILLFIGDGMGDAEITLARYYAVGAVGRLALDTLPLTGAYTTYAVEERDPSFPNYVPDSASTGTAWATGHKTSNGRISTSAREDRDLPTILEIAQQRGYLTGDVTTAELTDATPAVLAAHVARRACQGPADMAACPQDRRSAGGPGSIAEQEVAHNVDVLMGGGAARFEQTMEDGRTPIQEAARNGYQVIRDATGLEHVERGRRLLGLFAQGNMTTEWSGQEARPYPSNVTSPQRCKEDHRPAGEPALAQMTATALALLDRPGSGPGFFLQVEGASIDKQGHAADPCGQIGETVAFDRAIKTGIDYAKTHPRTLLVVTADHAHTSQIVGRPTEADHPTGLISTLLTIDRAPLTVSYGTNGYHRSQDHTGTQVRIAARGPQAAGVVGVIDQTDLFQLMLRALEPARD